MDKNEPAPSLDLLRSKNEEAISAMVKSELPKIYNLCLRLCGRQTEAEDLCQDVFVRALKGIANFKGDSSLSTWLYKIAVNTWKNKVRYESKRYFRFHISLSGKKSADEDSEEMDLPDPNPFPEDEVHRRLMRDLIFQALSQLDKNDKTILILRDVEERSYEEIASLLDLNLGTVKSRLSRAREALRAHVLKLGGTSRI